jgi:hypothetical protein
MFALITAGIAIGMLGSFHCIGMCGPLALSLPVRTENHFTVFGSTLLYNAGRIITYSMLGLVIGLIGRSMFVFGLMQFLSVTTGLALLLFLLPRKFVTGIDKLSKPNRFFIKLRMVLGRLYNQKSFRAVFLIGLLNGLLPCGLVYMAIAGALVTGDPFSSMLFMAAFGLGTLPLMWALSFFGNFISISVRIRIRKLFPYAIALVACLLIVRGLGLGIPYLSPRFGTGVNEAISCGN